MPMSKTEAIKAARQAISMPSGSGTSWRVYMPYYRTVEGISGPSTELQAPSYHEALARRTQSVATLALCLMGIRSDEADFEAYITDGPVLQKVNAALKYVSEDKPVKVS